MRFNDQCPECGEWKWCGHECEFKQHIIELRKPVIDPTWDYYRDEPIAGSDIPGQAPEAGKPKFDRKTYMRERWRKKKAGINDRL